jgi:hypothetical protein
MTSGHAGRLVGHIDQANVLVGIPEIGVLT